MRIGVAGFNASGKTEVVGLLERRGFYPVSLSDVIRLDLRAEGLEPTREHMIERGRALRARYGLGVLAERVRNALPADRNHVIDSIRHPAEVEALREGGQPFHLIWLEADVPLRFERLRARARPGDPETLDRFRELEARELESDDPTRQQLLAVRELADYVVENDGTLDHLYQRLQEVLRGCLFF